MARLPPPVNPPPLNCLAVAEVYLDEPQALPNLPVFGTGGTDARESYREVAKVSYFLPSKMPCLGVTIDAKPAATREIDKRISVAINGIVSLLCPSQDMKAAIPGMWVYTKANSSSSASFRPPYQEKLPKLFFAYTVDSPESIIIGRLLIKDNVHNTVTVDLCPF